jgi:hypothetical protein
LSTVHTPSGEQALFGPQAVPGRFAGFEQVPLAGSQIASSWQASPVPVQVTWVAPVQLPLWQLSASVHALWSSHAVPFALGGFEQRPVVGLHVPASWHWSEAMQVTGVPGWQTPVASQVSAPLHGLPSLQAVPEGFGGFEQAPVAGLQAPTSWQAS